MNTITGNIFTATAYNHRGQITSYALGNGRSTARGYDDFGFPTTIQTPGIQNLEYNFNTQTGNLNYRKDVPKNLQENFTYDNLMRNRLETWQVTGGSNYSANYHANGNIDTKTGLGEYSYGDNAGPHAVTGVENTGGLVSETGQRIAYTPFNKADTITEGDYRLVIVYGPDDTRKITRLYHNDVLHKTRYFAGGVYEEEKDETTGVTTALNYINAGDGLAAIYTGNSLYYIHKDHLGSYQAVTNSAGALVEELSFDPWGRRRNPTDWTYNNVPSSSLFGRGFTGHEHLDRFNLINMNGRIYDPVLGRFLSPDNYIQAPDYSQSMNRYSYCLNNPLIYTDPSGNSFIGSLLKAWFGNYVIGGMDRWVNKDMSFNDAFFNKNYITASANVNFSPGNFTQQYNYGLSNYQVDAYDLVQNELKFEQRYDRWEDTQRGRGRRNHRGIFGTNYEMGPVGIGVNIELGLPEWLPYATHNKGFGLSFGFVADSKDNLDFYITERTPRKNNVSLTVAPEFFFTFPTQKGSMIYNSDMIGSGYESGIALKYGVSLGTNSDITYRQWSFTGFGFGMDVGSGNWETYTKLHHIIYGNE